MLRVNARVAFTECFGVLVVIVNGENVGADMDVAANIVNRAGWIERTGQVIGFL